MDNCSHTFAWHSVMPPSHCPHCGACLHCGAPTMAPRPWPTPYYPPYRPYGPVWINNAVAVN